MSANERKRGWVWWTVGGAAALGLSLAASVALTRGGGATLRAKEQPSAADDPGVRSVEVVHPEQHAMERSTRQPGSLQAFESVQLFAGVSGYLRTQTVDLGDRITRGQVLATVAVPELEKQVQRRNAAVEQARAKVLQMKAWVTYAKAELEAARASVPQAEANAKSKAAELRFREKQLKRMKDLLALNSVDERLVDEKTEQRDAALEAEISAREGVNSARARVAAVAAKVQQAEADVVEADAEVKVAQAEAEAAQELVKFATIVAPFDGVVTQRACFPGDYIRSAASGANTPLFTVQRTDRMRVVVHVPDRDGPFVDPGDTALVEIDALPGEKLTSKVARVAQSQDAATRLMHVEIDLPNPTGKLRNGMYGRVSILLDRTNLLTVPSSCLGGKVQDGKGRVCVVRDGRTILRPVVLGANDGALIGILSGLQGRDAVVVNPGADVVDGTPVIAALSKQPAAAGAAPAGH